MATIFYRTIMATTFYSSIMATIFYSYIIDNIYCWYYQWYKSFERQRTRDKWVPLPSTPPLLALYFYNILLLGVYGGICYYWGWVYVYVSSGSVWWYMIVVSPYAQNVIVVGGIYFFKNFLQSQIVENYQRQETNNYGRGLRPQYNYGLRQ